MSADPTPAIRCERLTKQFDGTMVLEGFDLAVPAGSILGLLGPSGSGKTTALRIIAGFEKPDSGTVEIAGRVMVGPSAWVPPERRRMHPETSKSIEKTGERVLVIRFGAIGDCLRTLPAVRRLRLAKPHAEIAWAVENEVLEGNQLHALQACPRLLSFQDQNLVTSDT